MRTLPSMSKVAFLSKSLLWAVGSSSKKSIGLILCCVISRMVLVSTWGKWSKRDIPRERTVEGATMNGGGVSGSATTIVMFGCTATWEVETAVAVMAHVNRFSREIHRQCDCLS